MNKNRIRLSVIYNFIIKPGSLYIKKTVSVIILIISIILFFSCDSDEIGDSYYTFTGETVGDYITNRPENFSEFGKVLKLSGIEGLLKAYGKYTCFLPNNEAMYKFYELKGKSSVKDFTPDTLKKIVYDHLIKDLEVTTDIFVDGFLPYKTMNDRFLKISIESGEKKLIYTVNTTSVIDKEDIEVHNGVIHTINEVLAPTENSLVEAIASDEKFSLFYDALMATELYKKLEPIKDESYFPSQSFLDKHDDADYNDIEVMVPKERKYGFTAFIESNATYEAHGIKNLDDLKAHAKLVYDQLYPQHAAINDITDSLNSLNRFIAYHLINKKLSKKLIIEKYDHTGRYYDTKGTTHSVQTIDMFEYIETMCPNTLLEVRTLRETGEYNIFNMIPETGDAIRLTDDFDNDAVNGVYHEIDNLLAYTPSVDRMLSSKRLRMDAASFFPEFTNNNMRVGHYSPEISSQQFRFPPGYIDRVKTGPSTVFGYINSDDRFLDYQGDEIFLTRGLYDFEITTPPIPIGTYEIRFGYQPTPFRGAAQLYWDGIPTGIPLDLQNTADDAEIGYVMPGTDPNDPDGFENDKMLRNRNYMKAPDSFRVLEELWYKGTGRMSEDAIRRILGIYTFTEASTHTFTVKAVREGEFMFDYLEFVPIEVLEYEDIY